MRRLAAMALILAALTLAGTAAAQPPGLAQAPAQAPDAGCRSCHPKMRPAMPPPGKAKAGHALTCISCHLGFGQAKDYTAAHRGLVANPSSLDQAGRACGPCHDPWPERVQGSPMASAATVIAMTRFLWGAQPDASPRFGVRAGKGLLALPTPRQTGAPVDDLLRRRCLRCHLWSKGAELNGARRSSGCAACHRPRDAAGRPPTGHGLTKRIPVRQCLTCHGGCGAGAQYTGMTPRDPEEAARFLDANPEHPALWQGRSWRPMRPDTHFSAGLACIDCHTRGDVMGDGTLRPAAIMQVGVRCTTCHGRPGQPSKEALNARGERLSGVHRVPRGLVLVTKLEGQARLIPALAGGQAAPVAHIAPGHQNLACHACHGSYNPADWGTMALLERRQGYGQWRPLAAQGDPQVLALLQAPAPAPPWLPLPPLTTDYLSGETRPGMWVLKPFFRRQTWRVYGRGPDGRAMLLAPRFGWLATIMDQDLRLISRAQAPRTHTGLPGLGVLAWNPHTTARAAPACADCHGSAMALGLGLTFRREPKPGDAQAGPRLAPRLWLPAAEGLNLPGGLAQVTDLSGRPLMRFMAPGSGPFPPGLLRMLLQPDKLYTRWLLRDLKRRWPQTGGPEPGAGQDGAAKGGKNGAATARP